MKWAVWFVRGVGFLFVPAAAFVSFSYPMASDSRFISLCFAAMGLSMLLYRQRAPKQAIKE